MAGKLYGVGVGPGNPKMMTYMAVEAIENSHVIAVPADGKENAVSYKIAKGIVKEIDDKECINIVTPMTRDKNVLDNAYESAAKQIAMKLDEGKDVAYLTLGDPTVYSTYIYIHRLVGKMGYDTEIISGVPSFCAASARVNDSLVDRAEQLHIIPSAYDIAGALKLDGTKVLMKSGSRMADVKEKMKSLGLEGIMVENCGMDTEKVYNAIDEIPDNTGYYSLIIIK